MSLKQILGCALEHGSRILLRFMSDGLSRVLRRPGSLVVGIALSVGIYLFLPGAIVVPYESLAQTTACDQCQTNFSKALQAIENTSCARPTFEEGLQCLNALNKAQSDATDVFLSCSKSCKLPGGMAQNPNLNPTPLPGPANPGTVTPAMPEVPLPQPVSPSPMTGPSPNNPTPNPPSGGNPPAENSNLVPLPSISAPNPPSSGNPVVTIPPQPNLTSLPPESPVDHFTVAIPNGTVTALPLDTNRLPNGTLLRIAAGVEVLLGSEVKAIPHQLGLLKILFPALEHVPEIPDEVYEKVGDEIILRGFKNGETAGVLSSCSSATTCKSVAVPKDPLVAFPSIKVQGLITPEIAKLFQDAMVNDASLAFFASSFLSQLGAVHDAVVKGNDVSSSLLMLGITGGGLRDLYQQQAATYRALRAALVSVGIQDFQLQKEGFSAFLDDFKLNGFSADELAFLSQLGLTPDAIALMRDAVLAIDPSDGPTSFFSLLDGLAQIDEGIAADLGATPEPTTLLLWGTTMAGLGLAARWRRRH
jgi:hypothetical protein